MDHIADLILDVIGHPPLEVSGRFTESATSTTLVVRFPGGERTFSSPPGRPCGADCAEALLQDAAEYLFELRSPLSLALYHYPKDLRKCENAIRRSLLNELTEDDAPAYNLWGLVRGQVKDYEGAEKKFKRALIKIEQNSLNEEMAAVVYSNWGAVLSQKGRYRDARAKYRLAQDADPDYAEALYNWGKSWHRENKLPQATQLYREAIKKNPRLKNAYHNLAIALAQQGKFEESIQAFVDLEKINGGRDPEVHTNWARMLIEKGDCRQAIDRLDLALEITTQKREELVATINRLKGTPRCQEPAGHAEPPLVQ